MSALEFIPLLHGVELYGLEYMLQCLGTEWHLPELAFYGGGVSLYGVSLHAGSLFFSLA